MGALHIMGKPLYLLNYLFYFFTYNSVKIYAVYFRVLKQKVKSPILPCPSLLLRFHNPHLHDGSLPFPDRFLIHDSIF